MPSGSRDQARCLLEDMPVDAFKIGVLGSVENIAAIAEIVSDYPDVPLVLDPVLASGRGDELASDEMMHALRELLLPQTTIVTPNSLEARRLADATTTTTPSLPKCASELIDAGLRIRADHRHARAHAAGRQHAVRRARRRARATRWQRLPGSYHGSGCTLASAIAAMLANGLALARGGARRAGLHVAGAREGVSAPAWASTFPTACSGRAMKPTCRRRRRCSALHCPDARGTDRIDGAGYARAARSRSALRGLYAITPDLADTAI